MFIENPPPCVGAVSATAFLAYTVVVPSTLLFSCCLWGPLCGFFKNLKQCLLVQYIRCDVHTIGMGQAASMGSLLLAGGSPGCRKALPHASIMLHQPSGGAEGMASDIQIRAQEILRLRAKLNELYVHHTHQPMDEIERVMDRDYFMDAEQALEFGIIDELLVKRPRDEETPDGVGGDNGSGGTP